MYIKSDDCRQAQADKSVQCQAASHQVLQEVSEQHLNMPAAKIKIIRLEQIIARSEAAVW